MGSNTLWYATFEHAPVAMSVIDLQGRQIAGNAAYRTLLGYGPEELVDLDVARITRGGDLPWTRSYLERLGTGDIDRFIADKTYVRKDGSLVALHLHATRICDGDQCVALLGALTATEPPEPSTAATPSAEVVPDRVPTDVARAGAVQTVTLPTIEPGLHVLVVEDHVINQQLVRAQLTNLGHECVVVTSGEDCVAHLASPAGAGADLVLLDYHLPGIDGPETARRLRSSSVGDDLTIIGMTASTSVADRARCLWAGMDDCIQKPVGLAELAACLERVQPIRAARRTERTRRDGQDLGAHDLAPHRAVINETTLEALVSEIGSRATVVALVRAFLDELDDRLVAIVAARSTDDDDRLKYFVHTLVSGAELLGVTPLAVACTAFTAGDIDARQLVHHARQVRQHLDAWSAIAAG